MFECNSLIHPFQSDPGVSQQQREMDILLSGVPKIDGRSMADLLDYFVQLSPHVNFYDKDLQISNWQPFFKKSLPFTLAAIVKFDRNILTKKFDSQAITFNKHPGKGGLQLLLHGIFHQVIDRVNSWHLQLKGSGLSAELVIEKLIKDKLRTALRKFIYQHNVAVKYYCVKPVDFSKLSANDVWALNLSVENSKEACKPAGKSKHKRLIAQRDEINQSLYSFLDAIRIIADTAAQSLEQSLFPLKEELQKKHTPHLALLFAFLKLFQHLQGDLNKYTKKHLDFFYKQVLKLKARDAVPDKVHLVFEIQKQLDSYLLKKGLLAKDGKDNNKAEILFALDDELVVNKTQVADKRTLFLNNQNFFGSTYIEGVCIAPNADKADGQTKDFKDGETKSFATIGAKLSKYTDPEKTFAQPYPGARMGFILGSPVLLLNEGERTIDITLACKLSPDFCKEMEAAQPRPVNDCCDDATQSTGDSLAEKKQKYPEFMDSGGFYDEVSAALNETWIYVNDDAIVAAAKKGISKDLEKQLRSLLITIRTRNNSDTVCYCPIEIHNYDTLVTKLRWDTFFTTSSDAEKKILAETFKPRKALNISFSGEKEWLQPLLPPTITVSPALTGGNFLLKVHVTLDTSLPAVTFYDKEKLKEDFNTAQPLVKIELDDKVKLIFTSDQLEKKITGKSADGCCLLNEPENEPHYVSLYHFFRNVSVLESLSNDPLEATRIDVSVCGLKNFIVQNDESVQDVNAPVYPFGTRPEIIDFNAVNPVAVPPPNPNLIGPNFYLGSREIFGKKWKQLRININWKDKPADFSKYYVGYLLGGLNINNFKVLVSILENGTWEPETSKRKLFDQVPPPNLLPVTLCDNQGIFEQGILITPAGFTNPVANSFVLNSLPELTKYSVSSRGGFLKINLRDQDFLHKDYPFVLARQMIAFGKLPKEKVEGAIYYNAVGDPMVIDFDIIYQKILAAVAKSDEANREIVGTDADGGSGLDGMIPGDVLGFSWNPTTAQGRAIRDRVRGKNLFLLLNTVFPGIKGLVAEVKNLVQEVKDFTDPNAKFAAIIPNEPWTPIIKNISLDYTATAMATDIDLIHLYPYDGTYKKEELTLKPTLIPTFCDEGNLFIGLKDLQPGSNVNMLFQLAEATADSESEREEVAWSYLDNNQWKTLRKGFEVLDDATDGLTTSGIVKFALPENMTNDNTILPKDLHWVKAAVAKNSSTISETIAIFTQAIRATFTNEPVNDKLRLATPLEAGKISKLSEANTNVKKIIQPFNSFGSSIPEEENHFYVRVSERLRHKGRAIQKFDYERLVLEEFPQIFKVKCINHSFALNAHVYKNDFPIAPGHVLLAVIPDLNQLKAAKTFEPRVPVSLLDDIGEFCKKHTSPFVRFRAMNPRYEQVHFCMRIKLLTGRDKNYYTAKLKQDLREFMAPWAIGEYDKLHFGQCVGRSEVIQFLETRDYVDYIIDLVMRHDADAWPDATKETELLKPVCPKTPRSILVAGEIDVCIPDSGCEEWEKCLDALGRPIACCENEKILIADYCIKDVIG